MEIYRENIGGQEFLVRRKTINQMELTSECWPVQMWGISYCSGFGNPESRCEYLATVECGGYRFRKMMLTGKYPKGGLADATGNGQPS